MRYEPCEACGRPAHHFGLCRDCEADEWSGQIELRNGLWVEKPAVLDEEEYLRAG